MDLASLLLGRPGYLPHGYCFTWTPGLLWSMVGADALIAASYFSIPLAIASFVRRRAERSTSSVAWLFSAFIFACGTTHVLDVWTIWQPYYGLQALTKIMTAAISLVTAVALWALIPRALRIPNRDQLRSAIRSLEAEIAQRRDAEEQLVDVQQSLAEKRRAAQALEISLREKEVLLMEIHHRVKNNLQVMASLLHLQGAYVDGPAARGAFEESEARIKCMALIHEKLYSTNDLASIDFGDYLRDLVGSLIESHRSIATRVAIEVTAESVRLNTDRAIPCGLVLNELISNSLKHGYPDGRAGRVVVAMSGNAATGIRLSVRDDGVGWPAQFDPARSASMGLKLVYILAKQLRSELTFRCEDGIECTLRLQPESEQSASVRPESGAPRDSLAAEGMP